MSCSTSPAAWQRITEHYYFSFFILKLPRRFPELRIGPEGFLSKIAETFGYDAIGFESHEFSSLFCVRFPDKKFAYDICHARMIEYLLANRDLNIEIDGSVLAVCFENTMEIDKIERELNRLIEIRTLMPDYLFEDGAQ